MKSQHCPEPRLQAVLNVYLYLGTSAMEKHKGVQGHSFYTDVLVPVISKLETQMCFSKRKPWLQGWLSS